VYTEESKEEEQVESRRQLISKDGHHDEGRKKNKKWAGRGSSSMWKQCVLFNTLEMVLKSLKACF